MKEIKKVITEKSGTFSLEYEEVANIIGNLTRLKDDAESKGFTSLRVEREGWDGEYEYSVIASRMETDEEFKARKKKIRDQVSAKKMNERDSRYVEFLKLKEEFDPY